MHVGLALDYRFRRVGDYIVGKCNEAYALHRPTILVFCLFYLVVDITETTSVHNRFYYRSNLASEQRF